MGLSRPAPEGVGTTKGEPYRVETGGLLPPPRRPHPWWRYPHDPLYEKMPGEKGEVSPHPRTRLLTGYRHALPPLQEGGGGRRPGGVGATDRAVRGRDRGGATDRTIRDRDRGGGCFSSLSAPPPHADTSTVHCMGKPGRRTVHGCPPAPPLLREGAGEEHSKAWVEWGLPVFSGRWACMIGEVRNIRRKKWLFRQKNGGRAYSCTWVRAS